MLKKKKFKGKRILTCEEGDRIISDDKPMVVAVIICQGREDRKKEKGVRAHISACAVLPGGHVLTRSPRFIGPNWHY